VPSLMAISPLPSGLTALLELPKLCSTKDSESSGFCLSCAPKLLEWLIVLKLSPAQFWCQVPISPIEHQSLGVRQSDTNMTPEVPNSNIRRSFILFARGL
jgi:hypothetical protein